MLINKGISVGEIVCLKLISGEEIIAKLEESDNDKIKVNRPLSVSLSQSGLGMIPFIFLSSSESVEIKTQHIIAMTTCKKDAADQYIQGTTGIKLV